MTWRQRRLLPFTFGVLAAASSVVAGAPAPAAAADPPDAHIDAFQSGPATLSQTCPAPAPATTSLSGPETEILGGELDLAVRCDQPGVGIGPATATVGDGTLSLETTSTHDVALTAVWDGDDGLPTLDDTGLGGIDLTGGGTKDAFTFDMATGAAGGALNMSAAIEMKVYTDADHVSRITGFLHEPMPNQAFTLPFALFDSFDATPGADFTDVGAIEITLVDTSGTGPITIGPVHTTTVARPTMTDALEIDADGDGRITPGDTIEYTVSIANADDRTDVPAMDATFVLASFDGVFVPGSVTTTQGTVTTGNRPADTGVAVDLDMNVLDGSSPTITFQVVADAAGDLANQGLLTYEIQTAWKTTNTATETDDPETEPFSDATVTTVLETLPVVATDDSSETPFGTPVSGNVLANDTGPGTLVASLVAAPTNGTVVLNADGSFTYTPNAGFSGTDTFTYRATSSTTGASDDGVIAVTVEPAVEPVVAGADSYDTAFGGPVSGNVLANDTGGAGPLVAQLVDPPANGTVALDSDGSFTYTPDAGFSGTDMFTYRAATLGQPGPTGPTGPLTLALPGDIGTVTITVAPPPDTTPPTTTSPATTTPPTTTAPGTVPPPPTTGPLAPTIPATLPATGSDSSGLAMTALLVFGLGAILTLVVRKRRHA